MSPADPISFDCEASDSVEEEAAAAEEERGEGEDGDDADVAGGGEEGMMMMIGFVARESDEAARSPFSRCSIAVSCLSIYPFTHPFARDQKMWGWSKIEKYTKEAGEGKDKEEQDTSKHI